MPNFDFSKANEDPSFLYVVPIHIVGYYEADNVGFKVVEAIGLTYFCGEKDSGIRTIAMWGSIATTAVSGKISKTKELIGSEYGNFGPPLKELSFLHLVHLGVRDLDHWLSSWLTSDYEDLRRLAKIVQEHPNVYYLGMTDFYADLARQAAECEFVLHHSRRMLPLDELFPETERAK